MAPPKPMQALPRLLLIDDDPISREVLSMLLAMHGFPVDSTEDGAQALEFLQNGGSSVDAVLMDTQMPGLSGAELVAALRKISTAKIIAISGSDPGDGIRRATDGFLLKPVGAEDVAALLQAIPVANGTAAEPSTSVHTETIDPIVLAKLKAMMPPSAVLEIYTAVATDMESRLVTLSAAIDTGSLTEVTQIAHIIKGGCSMVGLWGATEAAARLETSNLRETWPKELVQLHFALDSLKSILVGGLL
jgi:CheY-like chemotaxis protein/HPt (histidine-containing phosphotransfer) domain-containing protein